MTCIRADVAFRIASWSLPGVLADEQQFRRPGSGFRMVTPMCRQGSTLLLMGSAVWLASVAALIGVALGGLVSLAVSRQQIREARAIRADEASQERYRRSVDRRFKAFSEFIIQHRTARGALQFYYSQQDGKPSLSDMNKTLRSARDSAAMVFLVLETERTYKACRGVLRVLGNAQSIVYENAGRPNANRGDEVYIELGRAMREFQNATKAELEVPGPEWPWDEGEPTEPSGGWQRMSEPGAQEVTYGPATMPSVDHIADTKVTTVQGMVTAEIPLGEHKSEDWLKFFHKLASKPWRRFRLLAEAAEREDGIWIIVKLSARKGRHPESRLDAVKALIRKANEMEQELKSAVTQTEDAARVRWPPQRR